MRGAPSERTPQAIGRRLKAAREALDLSQAELCRRTRIKPNTYNQWEKGARPQLDEAYKLVDELGYTLDFIYLGDTARLPHEIVIAMMEPNPAGARR